MLREQRAEGVHGERARKPEGARQRGREEGERDRGGEEREWRGERYTVHRMAR